MARFVTPDLFLELYKYLCESNRFVTPNLFRSSCINIYPIIGAFFVTPDLNPGLVILRECSLLVQLQSRPSRVRRGSGGSDSHWGHFCTVTGAISVLLLSRVRAAAIAMGSRFSEGSLALPGQGAAGA